MEWTRGKLLGKGSYGEVFLAIPKDPIHPVMAVKSSLPEKSSSLKTEHQILQRFRGEPGIIQCFGGGVSPTTKTFNLFLEYAAGGSLAKLIADYASPIPEVEVKGCARSLLKSIALIHSSGYVHCDIKPDNILIFRDRNDPDQCLLKVADFGLAMERREILEDEDRKRHRGTLRYMPPEVVALGVVSEAMDVWGLGCTVLEMLTGKAPWSEFKECRSKVKAEIGKGRHPEIPEWLSKEAKAFLEKCFARAWYERFPAEWLLFHPFVTGGGGGESTERRPKNVMQGAPLLPHQMFGHHGRAVRQC
ncbi:Mitogen-activated protein kinase kinase kinase 20 [Linum grandiflorum]